MANRKKISVEIADEIAEIVNKAEFFGTDAGSYKHISLLVNVVDKDKLSVTMEHSNAIHSEANNSDLERFPKRKFDDIFIAKTEKKVVEQVRRTKTDKPEVKFFLIKVFGIRYTNF